MLYTHFNKSTAKESLTALWLMHQICKVVPDNGGPISIMLRSNEFPIKDRIQYLKDQASDPHSKQGVINLIGETLTQNVIDYSL